MSDPKQVQDEFRAVGTDNNGNPLPELFGFTSDWNSIRETYLKNNPTAVFIKVYVAVPDKVALAVGLTRGQLAEKSRG